MSLNKCYELLFFPENRHPSLVLTLPQKINNFPHFQAFHVWTTRKYVTISTRSTATSKSARISSRGDFYAKKMFFSLTASGTLTYISDVLPFYFCEILFSIEKRILLCVHYQQSNLVRRLLKLVSYWERWFFSHTHKGLGIKNASTVQYRKWSRDRKRSPKWTANDPRPQVIPKNDRKWSRETWGMEWILWDWLQKKTDYKKGTFFSRLLKKKRRRTLHLRSIYTRRKKKAE